MSIYSSYLPILPRKIIEMLDSPKVDPNNKISYYKQLTNAIMVISLAADYRAKSSLIAELTGAFNKPNVRYPTKKLVQHAIESLHSEVFATASIRSSLDPREMQEAIYFLDHYFYLILREDAKHQIGSNSDEEADTFLALRNLTKESLRN